MRTTKEQLEAFAKTPIGADLADAVEWLTDLSNVHCPVCGEDDGDHSETCALSAFLREPQGEVATEVPPNAVSAKVAEHVASARTTEGLPVHPRHDYRCNACEAEYEGEPQPEKETQT